MTDMNLSDLKAWRKMHGITQSLLAKAANISTITIGQIEAGAAKVRQRTLISLVKAIKEIEARAEGAVAHLHHSPAPVEPSPAPAALPALSPAIAAPVMQAASKPPRLTNIDIELISRVIQMAPTEKVRLLQSMMD